MATAESDLDEECHKNCSTCPGESSSYCQDCDKYLCATCLPVHNGLLTGHTVLKRGHRSEWGKQKEEKIWTRECKEHAGQLTCMFCSSHDIVCCSVCAVQKHNNFECSGKVSYLPDIAKGFCSSQEYREHLDHIEKVLTGLNEAEHKVKGQITKIHDAKDKAAAAMKALETRIGKLFNTLQETSRKEMGIFVESLEQASELDLASCETNTQELNEMKEELREAENSDEKDISTFICAKGNRKEIQNLEIFLYSLVHENDYQIKFSSDKDVEWAVELLENAVSFGLLQKHEEENQVVQQQEQEKDLSRTGTWIKFNPVIGQDTVVKNGVSTNVNTKHQWITAMKYYENISIEELRLEDYTANRKGKQVSNTPNDKDSPNQNSSWLGGASGTPASQISRCSFGSPASTVTSTTVSGSLFGTTATTTAVESGFSFGSAASTVTSTTVSGSLFGKPATATVAASGFSFGSPITTVASTTASGSLFEKPATTTAAESGFSFGSAASTVTSSTVSGSPFGKPATTTVAASGFSFGSPITTVASTTVSGSLFEKPATTTAAESGFSFGSAASTVASTTVSGSPFRKPATTTAAAPGFSFGSPVSTLAPTCVSDGLFGKPEVDEEKMFGERAKLFRYDTESKQWKEQGIGEIKILRHKATHVHRILMRRDQVLMLCANHKITKDLKLAPMATSEKAWVWKAADFSEGEVKTEKLAVRFKNQDIAVNFQKTVEACQETMKAEEAKVDEKKTEKKEAKKTEKEEKKAAKKEEKKEPSGKTSNLASLFKQKAGSWTCTGCYVPNGADILQCPCCNTMKPCVTKEDLPKKETPANTGSTGSSGFTFGSQQPLQTNPSGGFSLAPKPADSTSSQPQAGGFKFCPHPSGTAATSAPQTGGFKFGSSTSKFKKGEKKEPSGKADNSLASLLKQKAGSWTCTGCYVPNGSDILQCPCCNTMKPGVTKEDLPKKETPANTGSTGSSGFTFGSQQPLQTNPSGGFSLAPKPTDSTSSQPQAGGFKFGPQPSGTAATSAPQTGGFKFGSSGSTSAISAPQTGGFMFDTSVSTAATSAPRTGGLMFGSSASTAASTAASASPFGKPAATTSAPSSALSTFNFGDQGTSSEAPKETASTSGSGFNVPQPCKPTSCFTFGGPDKKTTEKDTAATSTGFNVNKGASKYTFGETSKENTQEKQTPDVIDSLLAQHLSDPDTKIEEVSSTTDESKAKDQDKPVYGSAPTSKFTFGPPTGGSSPFTFGSQSMPAISFGSTTGMNEPEPEEHGMKPTTTVQHTEGFNFSMTPKVEPDKSQPEAKLGGGFNLSLNMTPGMPSKTSPQMSSGFTSPKSPDVTDDGYYVNKEDDDIHFEPIIELPDKVEVKTGEEDEEVIFIHRAKLFRFTKSKWKERGLGNVKVLFCPDTNKARILMRREQILKLCCNHYISPELKLRPMPNTEGKALIWYAMDFSDGEAKNEQFSIKFKTTDIAGQFQKAVEEAKERVASEKPVASTSPGVDTMTAVTEPESELGRTSDEVKDAKEERRLMTAFTIGSTSGMNETEPEEHKKPTTQAQPTEAFKFSTTPKAQTDISQPEAKLGGGFNFSLNMTPDMPTKTSPQKSSGLTSPISPDVTDDGYYVSKEDDDIHFEPIIGLPDKVEVKTGEEDEEVIFIHRAKLFRFTKSEWKERGLGNVKVLFCPDTNKARILMRREQILKLCCNHYISPELKLRPMPNTEGKALIWYAMDFSDGEAKNEQFSIKFKTTDIAGQFQKAVEEAKERVASEKPVASTSPGVDTITAVTEPESELGRTSDEVKDAKEERRLMTAFTIGSTSGMNETEPEEHKKPTTQAQPTEAFKFSTTPKAQTDNSQPEAKLGGGFNFSLNMTPDMPTKTSPQKSSGLTSPISPDVTDDGYYVSKEDDDIHFEPIIELPDKVEVKTGEEDEEVIFIHRAKLFRFTKAEWKERGLGNVKVLFNPDTNKARILMRREQILKLCCNHYISPELKLRPMPNTEGKALIWYAMDFSDGEAKNEQFSIKFKTTDIAGQFQKAVEEAKERVASEKPVASTSPGVDTMTAVTEPESELGRTSDEVKDAKEERRLMTAFTIGSTSGMNETEPEEHKKPTTQAQPTEAFKFSTTPKAQTDISQPEAKLGGGFNFSLNMTPDMPTKTSPQKSSGLTSPISPDVTDDGYYVSKEDDDIHFEPIIGLPDKVEVKTGEEDEEVIFIHRAKLFRFTKSEWKERGLGNVKVLFCPDTNKARILMRREQILKLCCNHYISPELKLRPMPNTEGKALIWYAMDFSDGEAKNEQFSIKFKTTDIAGQFQKAVEEAKERVASEKPVASTSPGVDTITAVTEPESELGRTSDEVKDAKEERRLMTAFTIGSTSGMNETEPEEHKKPTTQAQPTEAFKFSTTPKAQTDNSQPEAKLGGGFNFSLNMTPDMPTKTSPQKSSGLTSPISPDVTDDGYYVSKEDDDIHFEPIIELPDKVEVKTGEEDEEVIFIHRAKLFRFTKAEWKERGLGNVKVLFNPDTNKARILMRREQILKLCCNHYISPELKLRPMPNTEGKALIWFAMDFSDGEAKNEQFSIKFKTTDIAGQFQKAVEEAKERVASEKPVASTSPGVDTMTAVTEPESELGRTSDEVKDAKEERRLMTAFTIGSTSGMNETEPEEHKKPTTQAQPTEAFKFSTTPKAQTDISQPEAKLGGGFNFSLNMTPDMPTKTSPQKSSGLTSPISPDVTDDGYYVSKEDDDIHFEPIIGLPDKVEVKTGEEDEEVIFIHRAKLFRFTKSEWKERGLGNVKVLFCPDTNKARILMRREQILKLCCNHYISPELKLRPMPNTEGKALIWYAMDFSDGEAKNEQFSIKFKTTDIAGQFQKAVEEAKERVASEKPVASTSPGVDTITAVTEPESELGRTSDEVKDAKEERRLMTAFTIGSTSGMNETEPEEHKKPTTQAQPTEAFKFSTTPKAQTDISQPEAKLGGGFNFSLNMTPDMPTKTSPQKSSGLTSPISPDVTDDGYYVSKEDDDIHFEPIIGLPDKVEVKTGEEDEEVIFIHRAKLFRFTKSEWKERGLGNVKVLFCPDTNKARILMRREQILKLCCNHYISPELKLRPMPNTEGKALIWYAMDFSDGEAKNEQFSIKFKTTDIAGQFQKAVEEAKERVASEKPVASTSPGVDTITAVTEPESELGRTSDEVKDAKEERRLMTAFTIGSTSGMNETEPEEHKKPTTQAQPTEAFKFSTTPKAQTDNSQPEAKLGGGFNFSLNMTPDMPTKTSPQKSSGLTSPISPDVTDDGYYVSKEDDDIHFEPIIELPDKVEVKTGEEDEEVIFIHRAKLFRFTKAEWKERGLGNVKVLFCPDTNKARILMRREQILKLCCNHYVTPELKLRPMPNTEGKALIWYAMDFSDGEPKNEQFSIKFKTADIAGQFQKAIEEAKERVASDKPVSSSAPGVETICAVSSPAKPDMVKTVKQEKEASDDVIVVKEENATPDEIARARELMLPDHFFLYRVKPACPGCRGCEDDVQKSSDQAEDENTDDYDTANDENDVDDVDTKDDEDDDDDNADEDEDDDDDEEETNEEPAPAKSESGSFVFGGGSVEGMSFSSLASTSSAFQRDEIKPFNWHGAGQQLLGGGAKPRGGDEGSGDEDGVEQGEEPHFKPIVPLPELIDVKTGEEDESKEFAQRARLYRFDATKNEWKEKGVGEMKILKHNETGKYRLLLRREQVHKLACNHLLTPDLNLQPMNTSVVAWCWVAQDYSENEPKVEKLAVRFKTIELAQSFKSKVEEIQDLLREQGSSYENKPFNWHGAGQQLFGGGAKPRGGDGGSGDEDGVEQGEEPHFEPIVPLPELIDVKTGEEDETKEFCQRARLYRFDATKNEWKEKGVGEMKILKHNETGKYRLLLRREQVHKLACNHMLTPDLNLQPMNTSDVAWCWVAQDYSENEPKVEKLAVRFKTIELAQSFKNKVDEIQDLLRERGC